MYVRLNGEVEYGRIERRFCFDSSRSLASKMSVDSSSRTQVGRLF